LLSVLPLSDTKVNLKGYETGRRCEGRKTTMEENSIGLTPSPTFTFLEGE
jgi:hypothetical protein